MKFENLCTGDIYNSEGEMYEAIWEEIDDLDLLVDVLTQNFSHKEIWDMLTYQGKEEVVNEATTRYKHKNIMVIKE